MQMTKVELRKLARQVIKTNLIVWKAIYAVEELSVDNIHLMSKEDMEKLAKIMVTLKGGTEEMADPEFNGLYFQQFEEFGEELQEYLDKYEIA